VKGGKEEKISRKGAKVKTEKESKPTAHGHEIQSEPQMDQPSREAMAGNLQVNAHQTNSQKVTKGTKIETAIEKRYLVAGHLDSIFAIFALFCGYSFCRRI